MTHVTFHGAMTTINYDARAKTYDDTRGASPSVLTPLREALGPPERRSLLDIGGGTGNFARTEENRLPRRRVYWPH